MIAEKIDNIVAARKVKLEMIKAAETSMTQVYNSIKKIETIQRRVNDGSNGDLLIEMLKKQPEVCANISQIDTNLFYKTYYRYHDELDKLKNRFGRESLNISFVGAAGQGKSCVLQRISGLGGDVIPSAQGSDCTGAKSIISNVPDSHDVMAEIDFYNEDEIIDIVNGYLVEISGSTKYNVRSVREVSMVPVNDLEELVRLDANAKGKLKQLRKYVEHLSEVSENIGHSKTVSKDEIEKYVAQHSRVNNNIHYYDYLCVKCANIICQFPKKDAGRIVLVDTKGLGDTAMKVDENMLDAAENDSDAIILMYRPDALRAGLRQQEIDILKKIEDTITPQYCEKLLFWLVNRVSTGQGRNLDVIDSAVEEIKNSKMPVAGVLDVDCNDAVEVEKKLLEPVLEGLTERIDQVDNMIIERFNDIAKDLLNEYKNISSRLEGAFLNSAGEDVKRKMNSEILNTRDSMLNDLREIFYDLDNYRKIPNERFKIAGDQKLKNVLRRVPSQDQVVNLLNIGTKNHINVYEECTHIIRMAIIDDFLELDDILNQIVDEVKERIITVLTDRGKMDFLVPYKDILPNDWFNAFVAKINNEGNKYPLISNAVKELERFIISVEGFLIYEVRDKLDPLDPSLHAQTPQINPDGTNKEEQAKDIIFWLDKYINDVYDALRKALVDFYKVPNRALFAATKDFYDRITYSQKDTYNTAQEEWRYLYEEWLPVIWEEEYAMNINGIEAYKEWLEIVKDIQEETYSDTLIIR